MDCFILFSCRYERIEKTLEIIGVEKHNIELIKLEELMLDKTQLKLDFDDE
jgi:hypothetical protein